MATRAHDWNGHVPKAPENYQLQFDDGEIVVLHDEPSDYETRDGAIKVASKYANLYHTNINVVRTM